MDGGYYKAFQKPLSRPILPIFNKIFSQPEKQSRAKSLMKQPIHRAYAGLFPPCQGIAQACRANASEPLRTVLSAGFRQSLTRLGYLWQRPCHDDDQEPFRKSGSPPAHPATHRRTATLARGKVIQIVTFVLARSGVAPRPVRLDDGTKQALMTTEADRPGG